MLFSNKVDSKQNGLALTDLTQERSWKELNQRVISIAHYINEQCGVLPGQHVALHIGNRVEFIEAMLAGIVAGVWVTPINTHLTIEEARYILEDCDAKVLFFDDENSGLENSIGEVRYVNTSLFSELQESDKRISYESPAGGTMLYTSGTTGKPKGVKRFQPSTLGESLERMRNGAHGFGLNGEGPHLVTGPLYHAAPMLFAIYDLLNGAPMIIMPRWDTSVFLECVDRFKVVSTHLVPTMFVRLLNDFGPSNCRKDISSLRLALHGAAPIAKSTKLKMLDWWGDILVEYWGGSEAGTTTLVKSEEWKKHPGTVGKPLAHFDVFIGDKNGNPINDKEGMLFCRHHNLSQVFEYHKDINKTLKAHPKPNVFCIGDIGYLDADGFVYLSDRESNMIISGGVNIYPAEVEQALIEHENILDCVVFGVSDDEWGEQVKAIVQLNIDEYEDCENLLKSFLAERIAKYKIPRSIQVVNQIPRTPTGKVKSKDLEPYRTVLAENQE